MEMHEILSRDKKLPSLLDLILGYEGKKLHIHLKNKSKSAEVCDKAPIEQAFIDTSKIIFGKPLEGGVDKYANWLTRHTRPTISGTSALSGKKLFMPNAVNYTKLPKDRLLGDEESFGFGEKAAIESVDDISLENAGEKIADIAFFNTEFFQGNNKNNIECAVCVESVNNYRNSLMFYSKNSAYNFWPRDSDHIFGCDSPFSSSFSINCYSCTNQVRCFEIDCC
jgi:hypothetical protein